MREKRRGIQLKVSNLLGGRGMDERGWAPLSLVSNPSNQWGRGVERSCIEAMRIRKA